MPKPWLCLSAVSLVSACGADLPALPDDPATSTIQSASLLASMPADAIPAPADYDGDGCTDLAAKGSNGVWYIDYCANGFGGAWDDAFSNFGTNAAIPVPADYDGDGRIDLAIKDDTGMWAIDYAANGFGAIDARFFGYGGADAVPVPADYDGDGKADLAIKNSGGGWYVDFAADGFGAWNDMHPGFNYGPAAWVPVPGYYSGFGHCVNAPATTCSLDAQCGAGDRCARKADLAIKTSSGDWYIDFARNGFGAPCGDKPCMFDQHYAGYGDATAVPVPADYDGDGYTDLAVKTTNGDWLIDYAAIDNNGNPCVNKPCFGAWNLELFGNYQGSTAVAAPGNYTPGDGPQLDLAVEDRAVGLWSIDKAANGYAGLETPYVNTTRPQVPDSNAPYISATTLLDPTGTAVAQSAGRYLLTTGVHYTGELTIEPGDGKYQTVVTYTRDANYTGPNPHLDLDDPNVKLPSFIEIENEKPGDPGVALPPLANRFHRWFSLACKGPGVGLVAFELHDYTTHVTFNRDHGIVVECAPPAGAPTGLHGVVTARGCSGSTCGTGAGSIAGQCGHSISDGHYTPGCPLRGATITVPGLGTTTSAADGSWSFPNAAGLYNVQVHCAPATCSSPTCPSVTEPRADAIAVHVTVPTGSAIEVDTPLEERFFDDAVLTYTTYLDYAKGGRTLLHVVTAALTGASLKIAQNPAMKTLVHAATADNQVLMNGTFFDVGHTSSIHVGNPLGYFFSGGAGLGCAGFATLGRCSTSNAPCYVDENNSFWNPPSPFGAAPGACHHTEQCNSVTAAESSSGSLPSLAINGTGIGQRVRVIDVDSNFWQSSQFTLTGIPACPLYDLNHDGVSDVDYLMQQAGGGASLVTNGQVTNTDDPNPWPRTAIGLANGGSTAYLVIVDGEGIYGGHGASFARLARFFVDALHVDRALQLDGGNSTELVMRGRTYGGLRHVNTLTSESSIADENPFGSIVEADQCRGSVGNHLTLGFQ